MTLVIEATGPLATVQDLGRPGHAAVGVPESGALDRAALRLANAHVGNPLDAPAVEALLGGLVLRAEGDLVVAVTGTDAPLLRDGEPVAAGRALPLAAGERLAVGMPSTGLWSYLAVRGGLVAERVYGSASTDRTSGIGPPALSAGQRLHVGAVVGVQPLEPVTDHGPCGPGPGRHVVLHAVIGPRDDWFPTEALGLLRTTAWVVTSDTDRVGTRLAGPALPRIGTEEVPSEGVVRGSVQVPPSGRPLVFLADHPVTGGYPVIAVVDDEDTDRLAQVRPGERVRFALRRAAWS